jgi:hypothetical protein
MKNITNGTMITGASDDTIEIYGELRDEFSSAYCVCGIMAVSDGTLLNVKYDEDGIWRFTTKIKGSLFDYKVDGDVEKDTNDKIYFKTGLKWVAFSDEMQVGINRENKK